MNGLGGQGEVRGSGQNVRDLLQAVKGEHSSAQVPNRGDLHFCQQCPTAGNSTTDAFRTNVLHVEANTY